MATNQRQLGMTLHRPLLCLALLLGLVGGPAKVRAQDDPSADEITRALIPKGHTRGIRPVEDLPSDAVSTPDAPSPSAPTPHGSSRRSPGVAATSINVRFATGSATLTAAALATLDNIGRALSGPRMAGYRFRIEGHTDTVGAPALNKTLSEQRAQTVVDYVVTHYHVDPARLDAAGLGEDGLVVPTPPQTPEPRNRRVDIINLGS